MDNSLIKKGAEKESIDILCMGLTKAESVKLFSNTYLALRVAYFNELDTSCCGEQPDKERFYSG